MSPFTVHDLLQQNLASRADITCLIHDDKSLTYAELEARASSLARVLAAQGVQRGDRVVLQLDKSFDEVVTTFAIAQLGAVFVNVHTQWTDKQLDYVLVDSGACVLVTDARRAGRLATREWPASLRRVVVRGKCPDDVRFVAFEQMFDVPRPSCPSVDTDLAAILYTSGSTGAPKGVMFTHLNILTGARSVAQYLKNTADDRVLGLLPMCFDYGMNQVMTMFLVGGCVVLQPVMMPTEIVKTLQRHHVTGFAGVPPIWIQVARYLETQPTALPALRYITNSGGAVPKPVLEAFPRLFARAEIFLMYGLTEAFRSTFLPPDQFHARMGSMGKAIPNVEIFVVDPERGLCGPDEEGELLHRGSLISRGYWGKPEATDEKIRVCPHLTSLLGDEKVLYSGDIVRRDRDGYLWFVGRRDGMIKCSGFRISPTEVEEAVHASGLVEHSVAFGVANEELGQVVHLAVTWSRPGTGTEQLLDYCRRNLPHYMMPRRIHAWDAAMPRTASGKLDRPAVIASCIAMEGSA